MLFTPRFSVSLSRERRVFGDYFVEVHDVCHSNANRCLDYRASQTSVAATRPGNACR